MSFNILEELECLGGDLYITGYKSATGCSASVTAKPVRIKQLEGAQIVQVSCSAAQTIAVSRRGVAYTWGDSSLSGTSVPRRLVLLNGKRIIDSACGRGNALFVTDRGELLTWGMDVSPNLAAPHPTQIDLGVRIRRVCCGDSFCLALSERGAVFSWGDPSFGKLGLGPAFARRHVPLPKRIESLDNVEIITAAAGKDHVLAVSTKGDLYAWGNNQDLQCGMDCEPAIFDPRRVLGAWSLEWSTVVSVACGDYHSLLLDSAGAVWSSGRDDLGQLGRGLQRRATGGSKSTGSASSAVRAALDAAALAETSSNPTSDPNIHGILDSDDVSTFQKLETLSNVSAIAAGGHHSVAIRSHIAYTWGSTNAGVLGHGNESGSAKFLPEKVSVLSGVPVFMAACGPMHTVFGVVGVPGSIADMAKERRPDYTNKLPPIRIFLSTFNAAEAKPPAGSGMSGWLMSDPPCDLYAIGLQEIDMSAGAVLVGESAWRARDWESALLKYLPPLPADDKYVNLGSKNLVGIQLCIYVKNSIRDRVRDLTWYWKGVGLMGKMGNKGGVAASFKIDDSTIFLINSHFAAGNEHVKRRNENYVELSSTLPLCNPTVAARGKALTTASIFDSDFAFWLGDFNYRLDLAYEYTMEKAKLGEIQSLLVGDQLAKEQNVGSTFVGWKEGPINFLPTYPYDIGSRSYDTVRGRRPAWCDRVLWRAGSDADCVLKEYLRHEIKTSDHRPVSAVFEVVPSAVDSAKRTAVLQEIQESLRDLVSLAADMAPNYRGSVSMNNLRGSMNVSQIGGMTQDFVPTKVTKHDPMSLSTHDHAVSRLIEATSKRGPESPEGFADPTTVTNAAPADEADETKRRGSVVGRRRRARRLGSNSIGSLPEAYRTPQIAEEDDETGEGNVRRRTRQGSNSLGAMPDVIGFLDSANTNTTEKSGGDRDARVRGESATADRSRDSDDSSNAPILNSRQSQVLDLEVDADAEKRSSESAGNNGGGGGGGGVDWDDQGGTESDEELIARSNAHIDLFENVEDSPTMVDDLEKGEFVSDVEPGRTRANDGVQSFGLVEGQDGSSLAEEDKEIADISNKWDESESEESGSNQAESGLTLEHSASESGPARLRSPSTSSSGSESDVSAPGQTTSDISLEVESTAEKPRPPPPPAPIDTSDDSSDDGEGSEADESDGHTGFALEVKIDANLIEERGNAAALSPVKLVSKEAAETVGNTALSIDEPREPPSMPVNVSDSESSGSEEEREVNAEGLAVDLSESESDKSGDPAENSNESSNDETDSDTDDDSSVEDGKRESVDDGDEGQEASGSRSSDSSNVEAEDAAPVVKSPEKIVSESDVTTEDSGDSGSEEEHGEEEDVAVPPPPPPDETFQTKKALLEAGERRAVSPKVFEKYEQAEPVIFGVVAVPSREEGSPVISPQIITRKRRE